jgi:hypothetical protein
MVGLGLALLLAQATSPPLPTTKRFMDAFFCDGITIPVDANGYPVVRKAILKGNSLTVFVVYGSPERTAMGAILSMKRRWPLGFVLDGQPATGVHPFIEEPQVALSLKFLGLRAGRHRIEIGLLDPQGTLREQNSYCFTSPGDTTWAGYQH